MKRIVIAWIAGCLAVASLHAAELRIEWTDPEEFRDADYYYNGGARSKEIVLNNLEKYFIRLAERHLTEGTVLEMTVTELDLAGDFEPWRSPDFNDVRIVKEIYPALIEFDFRWIAEDGTVIAEGSERLRDTLVPRSIAASFIGRTENYPYVKAMVRDWMRKLGKDK